MFQRNQLMRLVLAIILAACVFNVQAQTPDAADKRAAIQELLNLIGATQTAKAMFVTLIDQYSQAIAKHSVDAFEKGNWSPDEKEKVKALSNDFFARLSQRLREEVPRRMKYEETVNRLYLEVYDQHFTEAEIRDLIVFHRSPVGQKFLGLGPRVSSTLQARVAEFELPTMTITQEIIAEELIQLEKRAATELKASTPGKKN